jgi:hypothetical protein
MTKKDYIKIAAILKSKRMRRTLSSDERQLLDLLIRDFADMLSEDNPRFDRERFLEAAGYTG